MKLKYTISSNKAHMHDCYYLQLAFGLDYNYGWTLDFIVLGLVGFTVLLSLNSFCDFCVVPLFSFFFFLNMALALGFD